MDKLQRQLVRAASHICRWLPPESKGCQKVFNRQFLYLQQMFSRYARSSPYHGRLLLPGLKNQIRLLSQLQEFDVPEYRATVREVYQDLVNLRESYADVEVTFDWNGTLIVSGVTETITLEGVILGRFRIRYDVNKRLFTAEALDPNPSVDNEEITHPHIHSGEVCLGEAVPFVSLATRQGRLLDAFDLVTEVLRNYEADAAYHPLDEWYELKSRCVECNDHSTEQCNLCEADVCEDHLSYCEGCVSYNCNECLEYCYHCKCFTCKSCYNNDCNCCSDCVVECDNCGEYVAPGVMTCETCNESDDTIGFLPVDVVEVDLPT